MPQDRFKQSTRLQKEPMFLGGEIEEGFLEEEAFYELFLLEPGLKICTHLVSGYGYNGYSRAFYKES